MQYEYRFGNREDLPALRELWKEAFGDGDSFLDQFFSVAFAPERSRVAVVDGAVGAALYWFPLPAGSSAWPISMVWRRPPGFRAGDCAEV